MTCRVQTALVRSRLAVAVLAACSVVAAGCGDDDEPADLSETTVTGPETTTAAVEPAATDVDGLMVAATDASVDDAIATATEALEGNEEVSVAFELDHSDNAAGVDLELAPTELLVFGNPMVGTPLMQQERTVAIDLPQKFLAWSDGGATSVAVNDTSYLAGRHGVEGEPLERIQTALDALVEAVVGMAPEPVDSTVERGAGLVSQESTKDFATTYDDLVAAIEAAGPLSIVAEIDHAANAESVGLDLAPTSLVVFGNPAAGTPLMQEAQSIGIDLPQKMLVYEEDGSVFVVYNDPAYLAERHGIGDADTSMIATALEMLAGAATG